MTKFALRFDHYINVYRLFSIIASAMYIPLGFFYILKGRITFVYLFVFIFISIIAYIIRRHQILAIIDKGENCKVEIIRIFYRKLNWKKMDLNDFQAHLKIHNSAPIKMKSAIEQMNNIRGIEYSIVSLIETNTYKLYFQNLNIDDFSKKIVDGKYLNARYLKNRNGRMRVMII